MSREIKFRGKHIHAFIEPGNTGIWVYGYLCDDHYINSEELGGEMLVDKDTIGQFTGLKDKNGKEIYEGDIVEINKDVAKGFDICNKGIINYSNGGFMVTQNDGTYQKILSSLLVLGDLNNIFRGNVIGNIYDNPELLKENNNG